jgi:hypothetical protein
VSIPTKVRNHLNQPDKLASDCIKWTLQKGNSTRKGISGGAGLDMLRRFVEVNNGTLEIFSQDCRGVVGNQVENYVSLDVPFRGTLVNISLNCV